MNDSHFGPLTWPVLQQCQQPLKLRAPGLRFLTGVPVPEPPEEAAFETASQNVSKHIDFWNVFVSRPALDQPSADCRPIDCFKQKKHSLANTYLKRWFGM